MKDISSIVIEFLERTVKNKRMELYQVGSETVYAALDSNYNTMLKFDLAFSDRAFVCQVLVHTGGELLLDKSLNIAWTDAAAIRDFFRYVESL